MTGRNQYGGSFHLMRHRETSYAAETILTILLNHIPDIHSAVDVGCGVGTFLSFLEKKGIHDVLGLDGYWVDQALLAIPANKFQPVDLKVLPEFGRTYDLAICLEVAEHLRPEDAVGFIGKLCGLSNLILFSAAVPGQGGVAHLNEAWQSYWAKLFAERDFYPVDLIRPQIWNDQAISFWYRQNILVYAKEGGRLSPQSGGIFPLDLVHPELFLMRTKASSQLGLFKRLFRRLYSLLRK